jgi:universal stress protein A
MSSQHFLVPLDFSPAADLALEYAIALAKKLQARLTLLHIVYLPRMIEVDITSYQEQMMAASKEAMATRLKGVQDAGVEGAVVTVHGVPFREIIETAQNRGVDLIIMGTHGRTGLQHAILGSVAEKVVRLAPCPVLVVRQSGASPAA